MSNLHIIYFNAVNLHL